MQKTVRIGKTTWSGQNLLARIELAYKDGMPPVFNHGSAICTPMFVTNKGGLVQASSCLVPFANAVMVMRKQSCVIVDAKPAKKEWSL